MKKHLDIVIVVVVAVLLGIYSAYLSAKPELDKVAPADWVPEGARSLTNKMYDKPLYGTIVVTTITSPTSYIITNYFDHPIVIYSIKDFTGKTYVENVTLAPGESIRVMTGRLIIIETSEGTWYAAIRA